MLKLMSYEYRKGNISPIALQHAIQVFGRCEMYTPHEAHIFVCNEFNNALGHWLSLQSCPGQYAECRNCDDRKCMDCVFRVWHDQCEDSCPMCCA